MSEPTVRITSTPPARSTEGSSGSGRVPVTVVIPTLNEAKNLPRCLDHLQWADEVVLVDSHSTDDTKRIAASYGARVIDFTWNRRWPKKKGWALAEAELKHEWVLLVDADEWIVPELAQEIAQAIKSNEFVGYWINRRFIFMGRWLKHCGYYPSWNLRLLKRGHGTFEKMTDVNDTGSGDNEVHEHIVPTGPVAYLKHDMLHLAFPTIGTFMEKHNRYSNWEAAVQYKESLAPAAESVSDASLSRKRKLKLLARRFPFRPTARFLYHYVLKLGFLDGRAGLTFCRLLMIYEYLSVAKFRELKQAEHDRAVERDLSPVPAFDWRSGDSASSAGPA